MKAIGDVRGGSRRRHARLLGRIRKHMAVAPPDWGPLEIKHPWDLRMATRLVDAGLVPEGSFVYRPWPKGSGLHAPGMTPEAWLDVGRRAHGDERCRECGNEIDSSKPGHGHASGPTWTCGHYTFDVNPEVIEFLKAQPKDATSKQLLDGWINKVLSDEASS